MAISNYEILSCKMIFTAFFVYFTTPLLRNSDYHKLQYASTPDIFVPPMQDLKTFNKTALKTFNKSELKTSDELILTKLNGTYLVNLSRAIEPDSTTTNVKILGEIFLLKSKVS